MSKLSRNFRFGLLLLFAAIALTSCSNAPSLAKTEPQFSYTPSCERISVLQRGRELAARDGVLYVAREPFSIRFNGKETEPALVVSDNQRLNSFLMRHGRKELWASMGDFMAHSPNDLLINDRAQFFVDEPSREKFAAMLGHNYPQLLRAKVAQNPRLDTATFIPKAGGFVSTADGESSLYAVDTINSIPVSESPVEQLHLTYFATVEKYAPPPTGSYRASYPLLIRMMWGSCVISFSRDA